MFATRSRALSSCTIRVVLLPLLMAVNGCSAYTTSFSGTTRPGTPITLTRLYVYSFLDIRSEALGPQMMHEITRQLGERLESRGVATEQHRFQDDSLAASFTGGENSAVIPISRVVAGNAAAELGFGADYRLLAFPAWMELEYIDNKPWYIYTFRWTLEDARTGQVVWSTTSNSAHHKVQDRDKDAVGRAGEIVNRLIREMEISGLFGAAPTAGTSR